MPRLKQFPFIVLFLTTILNAAAVFVFDDDSDIGFVFPVNHELSLHVFVCDFVVADDDGKKDFDDAPH